MFRSFAAFAVCVLAAGYFQSASASPIGDLQHLLNNAGFEAGPATGTWDAKGGTALTGFAARYDLTLPAISAQSTEEQVSSVLASANAALDADYMQYPTMRLPSDTYFVAGRPQEWSNIHNWAGGRNLDNANWKGGLAIVNGPDGKIAYTRVERYFHPSDSDLAALHKAGVNILGVDIGMDGAAFYDKCNYATSAPPDVSSTCYAAAYKAAKAEGWQHQNDLLAKIDSNPVVKLYVDSVARLTENGFKVMITPAGFFVGDGTQFDSTSTAMDPLFQTALMTDPGAQAFLPKFVAGVLGELRKRGITQIALESFGEVRYCPDGNPTPAGLAAWQAEERKEFDSARQVAPRLSLISTAICTEGFTYFDNGHPYRELGKVLPHHGDLDDVTYALHVYSPSLLFLGRAQSMLFADKAVLHYPYRNLPASAGVNQDAKSAIKVYDQQQPNAAFFDKTFGDIAGYAKKNGIHIMLTEIGIPKPQFGVSREERVQLLHDVVAASKKSNVPITYDAMFDPWGLSSCAHNYNMPDHRFDPNMMGQLAFGNGVPGVTGNEKLVPLDTICGQPTKFHLSLQLENETDPSSVQVDTLLNVAIDGGPGDMREIVFNVNGTYLPTEGNFDSLKLIFLGDELKAGVPAALKACKAIFQSVNWDGQNFAVVWLKLTDGVLQPQDPDCVLKALPKRLSDRIKYLFDNFTQIAQEAVASNDLETVPSENLKQWLTDVATGKVAIGAM